MPWAAHNAYNSCLPQQTKGHAMSSKKPKATRKRMISCFAQIVQEHIPGWKIEEIASGEKVKARKFSYSSQVYLLMLSQSCTCSASTRSWTSRRYTRRSCRGCVA